MRWVLQNNIYEEEGFARLVDALERRGSEVCHVRVVPFVGDLEAVSGELPPDGADAVVMGSYTLARVAKRRGWRPGAWLDNLDFRKQHIMWGDRMLNADAHIYEFGRVPFQAVPFFMRPVHDTKAFTGRVLDWGEYSEWVDGVVAVEDAGTMLETDAREADGMLTARTPVMVCSKKEIYSETRLWIVEGNVVTCSGYKLGTIKRYTSELDVEPRIMDFALDTAEIWTPNPAFVMDVADTPNGLKVVEINNLNSAGFYRANMNRLVDSIELWADDPSGLLW